MAGNDITITKGPGFTVLKQNKRFDFGAEGENLNLQLESAAQSSEANVSQAPTAPQRANHSP